MTSRSRALLMLSVAVAIALSGCSSQPGQKGDLTLKLASWVAPTSFDPAQAQEGHYVPFQQAVYDTLIRQLPDGTFAPMLAKSWKYNDDATELTLTLRDDVKFTDGTAMDAEVVASNLERFKSENGPQATTLAELKTVTAQGDSTVVLNLSEPSPNLLWHLSNVAGYIASGQALKKSSLATEPAGSGPYVLNVKETVKGSEYTFERNEDYWGKRLPYKHLVLKVLPDATARLNALKSGQVDAALLGDSRAADEAKASGFALIEGYNVWSGLALMDRAGQVTPALKDKRVRQALNMALDRAGIVKKILRGYGTATSQIWSPEAGGFVKDLDDYYDFDPKAARKLLSQAGYEDGFDLRLPTISLYDPSLKATIAQQLGDIGVRVKWIEFATGDFLAQVRSGDFSSMFMNLASSSDWAIADSALLPNAPYNAFGSTDPQVAGDLEKMRTASEDDRGAIAAELNKHLVESGWFLPIYRAPNLMFANSKKVTVSNQAQQIIPSIYNYAPVE